MSDTTAHDEDLDRLKKHARDLGDFFDTVQIFCTRHDPAVFSGTVQFSHGEGNFYARYGQAREWVLTEEERMREFIRKE